MSSQDQRSPYPFQSIGDLVAAHKDRVCAAMEAADEIEISLAHKELTPAKLRKHQKERLEARCTKGNGAKNEQLL